MHTASSSPWTAAAPARRPRFNLKAADVSPSRAWVPWLPWVMAGLLFGVLLFSFFSVVRHGVTRAEQQQTQVEARHRAERHCLLERDPLVRGACLAGTAPVAAVVSLR